MKNHKRAEALISVLITIMLISIVSLGMFSILSLDKDVSNKFKGDIYQFILQSNAKNIEKKLFFDDLDNNQEFYLTKDSANKKYNLILANGSNQKLGQIDRLGNTPTTNQNLLEVYKRSYTKVNDVLRDTTNPSQFETSAFHFDARKIGGNHTDGEKITVWDDTGVHDIDAKNDWDINSAPKFREEGIKGINSMYFDGRSRMYLPASPYINNGTFHYKTFFFVIKTGENIDDLGVIYKQGNDYRGYNLYIKDRKIHFSMFDKTWNTQAMRDFLAAFGIHIPSGFTFKVSSDTIYPNQTYFIVATQNSPYNENSPNLGKNNMQIYINGVLQGEQFGVPPMQDHLDPADIARGIGVGGIMGTTHIDSQYYYGVVGQYNFNGYIGEFGTWNESLSPSEVKALANYLEETWIGSRQKIQLIEAKSSISPLISK